MILKANESYYDLHSWVVLMRCPNDEARQLSDEFFAFFSNPRILVLMLPLKISSLKFHHLNLRLAPQPVCLNCRIPLDKTLVASRFKKAVSGALFMSANSV